MMNCRTYEGKNFFNPSSPIYLNISPAEPRTGSELHKHDFIEIAYVSSGKGVHRVLEEEYRVSKGDLCIINYGVSHVFIKDEPESEGDLVINNCVFRPEFIDYSLIHTLDFKDITTSLLFNTFFIEDLPAVKLKLSGTAQSDIEEIYRKMQLEFFSQPKGYVNILRSCLIEMLTKIFRYLEAHDVSPEKSYNPKSEIIAKAVDFLRENYCSSELNMDEVAIRTFLSRSYFSKLFKDTTGQNFSEYVQNLRITEACKLLKTTDKKVTAILYDVGFRDVKHFNRLFKKITGKTPGEYRRG